MARAMACLLLALSALLILRASHAFYLPGVAPIDFSKGDELQVKVNKLTSTKTQLPYDYYDLPYCKPGKVINSAENLGEVLRGDRIENSLYVFRMRENQQCNFVCRIEKLSAEDAKKFKEKIDDDYRVNMILDNLPVAIKKERHDGTSNPFFYDQGYPVGFRSRGSENTKEEDKHFIYNHLSFEVLVHLDSETTTARIVGFEVVPYSVHHEYKKPWDSSNPKFTNCNQNAKVLVTNTMPQEVEEGQEIFFTYDISFKVLLSSRMGIGLWTVAAAILLIWVFSFLIVCACSPPPQPLRGTCVPNIEEERKKLMLVIAHPDDESMFFAPTLLSLASLGCYNIRILCLSNGNAEGMGALRKQEMLSACNYLQVPQENVEVIDDPGLQDGHDVIWAQDLISQILHRVLSDHKIDMMVTFDDYGVSGHPNHIAVHRGVCKLLTEDAMKQKDKETLRIEAWQLASVDIIKKYSGPMYVLWSMWNNRNTDDSHRFYSRGPRHSIAAMRLHASQWLWYRRLFVIFSHYTYMNTLRKIKL